MFWCRFNYSLGPDRNIFSDYMHVSLIQKLTDSWLKKSICEAAKILSDKNRDEWTSRRSTYSRNSSKDLTE